MNKIFEDYNPSRTFQTPSAVKLGFHLPAITCRSRSPFIQFHSEFRFSEWGNGFSRILFDSLIGKASNRSSEGRRRKQGDVLDPLLVWKELNDSPGESFSTNRG